METTKPTYASFSVVMTAAGVLRAYCRSVSTGLMQLRSSAKDRIVVAKDVGRVWFRNQKPTF